MRSRADQSQVTPAFFPGSILPRTPPFPGAMLEAQRDTFLFARFLTRDLSSPETALNLGNNSHIRRKKKTQNNNRTKQRQYFNRAIQSAKGPGGELAPGSAAVLPGEDGVSARSPRLAAAPTRAPWARSRRQRNLSSPPSLAERDRPRSLGKYFYFILMSGLS